MERNGLRRSISQLSKRGKAILALWCMFGVSLIIDYIYVHTTSIINHYPAKYSLYFSDFNWISVALGVTDLVLGIAIFKLTEIDLNKLSNPETPVELNDAKKLALKAICKLAASFVIVVSVMSIGVDIIKFFS